MTEPIPKRINVAVNTETVKMLEHAIKRDEVSLTEAVRRLIGVGDAITRLALDDGATITASTPEWTRQVEIFPPAGLSEENP